MNLAFSREQISRQKLKALGCDFLCMRVLGLGFILSKYIQVLSFFSSQ